MAPTDPPKRDPAMDAYLASLKDLDSLDVDMDKLVDDARHDGLWTVFGLVAWLVGLSVALWLPSTLLYQLHAPMELVEWSLWAGLAAGGALLWRGVWALVTAWPFSDHLSALEKQRQKLQRAGSQLKQNERARLLAGGIAALGAVLVVLLPHEAQWQGQGYTGAWFLAALGAIATGILVGRFIIAHASIERPERVVRPPIVWPSWMRWATGATIVGLGGLILVLHSLAPDGDHSHEFTLAGGSLTLGVAFAIWLARRFDELETKWQKEAQERRDRQNEQDD